MGIYQVRIYERTLASSTIIVEAGSKQQAHDAVMSHYESPARSGLLWDTFDPEFDSIEIEQADDGDQQYRVVRGKLTRI